LGWVGTLASPCAGDYFIDEANNAQRWDGWGRLRRPVREGVSSIGD